MAKYTTLFLLFLTCFVCKEPLKSQVLFEQGICKCGVTAGGFSTGQGSGSGTVNLYIEPGSTIKKAYLFTYTQRYPPTTPIIINGIPYVFDATTTCIMDVSFACLCATPSRLYVKDITPNLTAAQTSTFNITIPSQPGLPINEGYWTAFLYIVYENPSLNLTNYNILINDKNLIGNEVYAINNLNPINVNFPVGFSLYTDRTGSNVSNNPSHYVYFNTNLLGIIGGSDAVNASWNNAGVKGHFYYQNNQLYGLDDDTPDAFMDSTDGLADVSSYIANLATSCNFQLKHIHYPNEPVSYNSINLAYFLTYSTPCAPIPATVSPDTTICYGEQVQLHATGGTKYEWRSTLSKNSANPAPGLSCANCPNPIFTGDSSQVYTVRIWSTDSCSVVRPVRIRVRRPKIKNVFSTSPANCVLPTGSISVNTDDSNWEAWKQWQVISQNGDTITTTKKKISGLAPGNYTLIVSATDTMGCKNTDTTVINIGTFNNTVANFQAAPLSGTPPFVVNIQNTSVNANQFEWLVNGVSQGTSLPQYKIDTSGSYTILLIASQNGICRDTVGEVIHAEGNVFLFIPQFISPNGDNKNDMWEISGLSKFPNNEVTLFNRWGNVVFQKENYKNNWNGKSPNNAVGGDGKVPTGTYFYVVKVAQDNGKKVVFKGYLEVGY